MKDPYVVLGISRDASDDEIKKAYRGLSRKYHPDANVNNPNKEQAEERFKEVQAAYEEIMNSDRSSYGSYGTASGGSAGYGAGNGGFQGYSNGTASYGETDQDTLYINAAYRFVENGLYREAITVLYRVKNKNARYYYVAALADMGLGNQVEALEHIRIAISMEPDNMAYQQFLQQLQRGKQWYTEKGRGYGNPSDLGNNVCIRRGAVDLTFLLCCGMRFCCRPII